jgi:hypothetical protein
MAANRMLSRKSQRGPSVSGTIYRFKNPKFLSELIENIDWTCRGVIVRLQFQRSRANPVSSRLVARPLARSQSKH